MSQKIRQILGFALVLLVLLPIYLLTLQTHINGAEHYFMIDVGETQAVLNVWGTLHATGYPLYVMVSSALVALLRDVVGIPAAAAPAVTSLLYGVIALGLFYALVLRMLRKSYQVSGASTEPSALSAHHAISASPLLIPIVSTILFGLLRTVWVHQVIAEIYSFGLVILLALLWVAAHPSTGNPRRIYWLALIGGLGVFHHRALVMAAPALLYAVWRDFLPDGLPRTWKAHGIRILRTLGIALVIGLLGFLPYLYLPARASVDAPWVYGEPGTWNGFWDQFSGREASRFIGTVQGWEGLLANLGMVNGVLITDLTLPGLLAGLLGLALGLANPSRRRLALVLLLNALVPYLFHVTYYTDILSALILPVLVSLALGWALLAEQVWVGFRGWQRMSIAVPTIVGGAAVMLGAALIAQNFPFIRELTTNATGLETIRLAEQTPPGSALMLDWGPRYFAVAFAHDVEGQLTGITPVDHKADFEAILQAGQPLITPDFTFYNRPAAWWAERLGGPVYLSAAAPRLVRISTQPDLTTPPEVIGVERESLVCGADSIALHVEWIGPAQSARDYSVFVHLLDLSGVVIAQADQTAPVYGWRATSSWLPGEVVGDVYPLVRSGEGVRVRYGLYYQAADGSFVNDLVREVAVDC
jgi:hypothetical protein